jgi:hypothetical protein
VRLRRRGGARHAFSLAVVATLCVADAAGSALSAQDEAGGMPVSLLRLGNYVGDFPVDPRNVPKEGWLAIVQDRPSGSDKCELVPTTVSLVRRDEGGEETPTVQASVGGAAYVVRGGQLQPGAFTCANESGVGTGLVAEQHPRLGARRFSTFVYQNEPFTVLPEVVGDEIRVVVLAGQRRQTLLTVPAHAILMRLGPMLIGDIDQDGAADLILSVDMRGVDMRGVDEKDNLILYLSSRAPRGAMLQEAARLSTYSD